MKKTFKVQVNRRTSEAVQKHLFSLGYEWQSRDKEVKNLGYPYLYLKEGGLSCSIDTNRFKMDIEPELSVQEVLEMRPETEKHEHHDILIAIAIGKVCQVKTTYGKWEDERDYRILQAIVDKCLDPKEIRVKPKAITIKQWEVDYVTTDQARRIVMGLETERGAHQFVKSLGDRATVLSGPTYREHEVEL